MAKTFNELFEERIGKTNNIQRVEFLKRSNRFVEIEDVRKYNHNHDALGRFTFSNGGSSSGGRATTIPGTRYNYQRGTFTGNGKDGEYHATNGSVANPISKPDELKKYESLNTDEEKRAEINRGVDFVERTSTTKTPKAFNRKEFNADKVMEQCGCSREDAEKAHEYALDVYNQASINEPTITNALTSAAKQSGGNMYGLDFRLKDETSLTRKIITDTNDPSEDVWNYQKAARNIKDAVRYTMTFDDDGFSNGYESTKKALEKQGFVEMRCRNYWQKYADGDAPIKSVQCVYKAPNGQMFELQFHTNNSQGAKELCHPMYEEARADTTKQGRKDVLNDKMTELYSFVSDPPGVYDIKEHNKFKKK